jgi:hypothetical protein
LPTPFDVLVEIGYTKFENIEGENWLATALPKVNVSFLDNETKSDSVSVLFE